MAHYDLIIIGTGAGGGALAYKLAPTGKKILILERGDYIPREKDNWSTQAVFLDAKYKAKEVWLDKGGGTFHPGTHYCVGGNTKVYGAALLRMRERDFGEVRHHGGLSPAWPISYQDLEPYYTEAEKLYHVHGQRGVDPTEPPAGAPYFYPPLKHEPRIQKLFEDMRRLGLKPFPLPIGARMGEDEPGVAPPVLDRFDGFPDPSETKADAHVVALRPALRYDNVTLMTDSYVDRLLTDVSGKKVKEVVVRQNGTYQRYSADIVVAACGAVNSAALLLRSQSDSHPRGLANGSGVVGRHYVAHNNSALLAISRKPNHTLFGKTIGLNDFYFGSDDFAYPLGHIQMLGKSDPLMFREDAPRFAPGFGPGLYRRACPRFLDDFGRPARPQQPGDRKERRRHSTALVENNLEGRRRLQKKLRWILEHAGCESHLLPNHTYLGKKIPIAGTAHQCGMVRFGKDPANSALNEYCRAHETPNLYVVDGSFFPSSSAVNPALTIIAQALRVGEHLIQEAL